jgi:hypothetical protein
VPIAVWLQSISGGNAVNPLVAFYDIHGRKREVLFFCSVLDITRDGTYNNQLCGIVNFCTVNGLFTTTLLGNGRSRDQRLNVPSKASIINFGHPSDGWHVRTLLNFSDCTPTALTAEPSSSSRSSRNLNEYYFLFVWQIYSTKQLRKMSSICKYTSNSS